MIKFSTYFSISISDSPVELLPFENEAVVSWLENTALWGDGSGSVNIVSGHHSHCNTGSLTLANSIWHLQPTLAHFTPESTSYWHKDISKLYSFTQGRVCEGCTSKGRIRSATHIFATIQYISYCNKKNYIFKMKNYFVFFTETVSFYDVHL